jgi:hypothetical protein
MTFCVKKAEQMRRLQQEQQTQVDALLLKQQQARELETMRSNHSQLDKERGLVNHPASKKVMGGGNTGGKGKPARAWR